MKKNEDVIVKVNQLKETDKKQSVIFNIFRMNTRFEKAIDLLKQTNSFILANSLNSDKQYKLRLRHVLYVEYVDRNIFLYTKDGSFWVKGSLVSIKSSLPNEFVQISKSMIINVLAIQTTETMFNGNLVLTLTSKEKVVVSRRYIKPLKEVLEKMI